MFNGPSTVAPKMLCAEVMAEGALDTLAWAQTWATLLCSPPPPGLTHTHDQRRHLGWQGVCVRVHVGETGVGHVLSQSLSEPAWLVSRKTVAVQGSRVKMCECQ